MTRGKTTLFDRKGDREVTRVERDGEVVYLAYLIAGNRRLPRGRFAWKGGEEDQVKAWLAGGPDPK